MNAAQDSSPSSGDSDLESLRSKTVVFVSPGYSGKRFIFEKAHELGIKSIVIDSPGSWTGYLAKCGIIDRLIEVDMSQSEDHQFSDSVSALANIECGLDGICTFVELSTPLTARLCSHFKLPGHTLQSVLLARNKHLTRETISKTPSTNMYSIKSCLIQSGRIEDITHASSIVGFPAVLKPVSGAASLGVQRVNTIDELFETYRKIQELLSELIVCSGALERRVKMENEIVTEDVSTNSSILSDDAQSSPLIETSIVLEEYLTGQEVDIDVVLCNSKITFIEISDNGPTVEPYFGETYNNCPTLLGDEERKNLCQMTERILIDGMQFKSGVFHVEAKYTPNGPRLIEVNCRMRGGPIRTLHLVRSGVDLVVEQIKLAVGLNTKKCDLNNNRPCVGFLEANARKTGSVNTLDFLESFRNIEGMVYVQPLVKPGEHIVGPEEGQPTWLVEAMFLRKCPLQAAHDSFTLYTEFQNLFEAHYA